MTQEALNIAGQCRATASSELAKNILVDEGNGLLTELLLDAARIIEALAQPEQDSTYTYASSLATAIWQKHYMKESPKWKPLDTTEGVLTQIDNMTCGLIKEKPAQPEQEPFAYVNVEKRRLEFAHDYVKWDTPTTIKLERIPLYTEEQLAAKYEQKIQELEDMVTELQERQA